MVADGVTEAVVRERLREMLRGEISLNEFNRWMVDYTWDIDQDDPKPLSDLVGTIKLRLAEYSNGHWLRNELRHLLTLA